MVIVPRYAGQPTGPPQASRTRRPVKPAGRNCSVVAPVLQYGVAHAGTCMEPVASEMSPKATEAQNISNAGREVSCARGDRTRVAPFGLTVNGGRELVLA